jgi:hypothetical protein
MSNDPTNDDGDAQGADEPAKPRQRSRVGQIPTLSGFLDAFAEGEAARDVRRSKRPTPPNLSAYRGHERVPVANLEDDEPA